MKKHIPTAAGILLGLAFVAAGLIVLLGPEQPLPPADSPMGHFMAAFGPTGWMTFVKVLEVTGGVLVAIPRTRCLGLLVLGPIIVNILAFHCFVLGGEGLTDPMLLTICVLAAYLLFAERAAFRALVFRP